LRRCLDVRVLVTGCAGFIGAHVVTCALRSGSSVLGLDNLTTDYDVRLKEWRLGRLVGQPGFRFCRADLTDQAALRRELEGELAIGEPVGAVIHLAGQVGLRRSLESPSACYESNVVGTLNLLELCRLTGVPRVVLASTAAVYSDSTGPGTAGALVSDSTGGAVQPSSDSPYAASKRAAEQLVRLYHETYGIDAVIARLFTVYGPAGHPEMSVFRFVRAIGGGEPVEILGDGTQRRDFTYVGDVVEGLVASTGLAGWHVIDLGTGTLTPVIQVVERLARIMGRAPTVHTSAAHPVDPPDCGADAGHALDVVGWMATTSLDVGLRQCVEWFEQNREWVTSLNLGAPYRTERTRADR
jgi:UDP-glucuronate 4-epimerase